MRNFYLEYNVLLLISSLIKFYINILKLVQNLVKKFCTPPQKLALIFIFEPETNWKYVELN